MTLDHFGWPWTADTHSCRKDAFYGARQKNLNDYRPKWPMIPVSRNIKHTRIFAGILGEGRQTTVELSTTSFRLFWRLHLRKLEIMPRRYYMAIRPNFHYANLLQTWSRTRFAASSRLCRGLWGRDTLLQSRHVDVSQKSANTVILPWFFPLFNSKALLSQWKPRGRCKLRYILKCTAASCCSPRDSTAFLFFLFYKFVAPKRTQFYCVLFV